MTIGEMILAEFDQEMAHTRKTLERAPEDKFGWAPHEKSMRLGRLAGHLAELPRMATWAIETEEFDFNPPGGRRVEPLNPKSRREALDAFDANVKSARAAIAGASDEHLMKPWTLLIGGQKYFTMPRMVVVRSWMMNHSIHHRAQLGVYLRLNGVPVPAIYGPTADEGGLSTRARA